MLLQLFPVYSLVAALLGGTTQAQDSFCHSLQYRALSFELQNEHQCMILEKVQEDLDRDKAQRDQQFDALYSIISELQRDINNQMISLSRSVPNKPVRGSPTLKGVPLTRDCNELHMNGVRLSGVYPLRTSRGRMVNVWCDMDTSYGGWTVIQKRFDGSENFARRWEDYAFGFGNVNSEYWIGNENIHMLTSSQKYSLRVDLWDWEGNSVYAAYDDFRIENEGDMYRLRISGYEGTAGDAMSMYHDNMQFSAIDRDNDMWHASCAKKDQSGWWFKACGYSSLNGLYIENGKVSLAPDGLIKGIQWYQWKNDYEYSLMRTEMKIKPKVAVLVQRTLERERLLRESKTTTTTVAPVAAPVTGADTAQQTTTRGEQTTSEPEGKQMTSGDEEIGELMAGGAISDPTYPVDDIFGDI